jgi:D-cysteine desulfhydrase
MNLATFPRRRYTESETPIEFLPRFTAALNGPNVYIKRDDLLGLAAGGNKTRKLEFLVADALAQGADTLITCGGVQSNHCRLTLAAAVKEGLKCRLVLEESVPGSYSPEASGNNLLFRLLGAEKIEVVSAGSDLMAVMQRMADALSAINRKGYIIPVGGSNPIGASGYVACAQEIQNQLFEKQIRIDRLVVATGSAGTQAGLLTGFCGCNMNIPIVGIGVSRDPQDQEPMVYELANQTADWLGVKLDIPRQAAITMGDYWRPGYSVPNNKMVEAVHMMAKTEGILLDPVYTGKAMAGLIDLSRKGYFRKDENVLFVHTGGTPGLYVYLKSILGLEAVAD